MAQKHVRIDQKQYKELDRIKDETGAPIAESVRRAIEKYLEKVKEQKQ